MNRISFRAYSRRKATLFALAVTIFVWIFRDISLADEISLPDDRAPIGVMGDHTHKAGEWMVPLPLRSHEIGWPLYQDLDGPQLKTGYSLTLGWQLAI